MNSAASVLSVRELRVEITRHDRSVAPVDDVSFDVGRGEIVGIAGESGSGKSLTLRSIIGLSPPFATVSGSMRSDPRGDGLTDHDPRALRGKGVSFVFQEPLSALSPTKRIGDQLELAIRSAHRVGREEARRQSIELLTSVGVPSAAQRARMWPHELSGGQRQRVVIALALATEPRLLLCDEPTTALDVSVQDQILSLLLDIRADRGLSVVFVSHDLAVLNQICDRIVVMYAGRVMETGPTTEVLSRPRHPYTEALIRSIPSMQKSDGPLPSIPGQPPDPDHFPGGCRFAPRCPHAVAECASASHQLVDAGARSTACIHADRLYGS